MSIELKIKAATLAAEARIIRRWENAIRREKQRQKEKFGAADQKTNDKFVNIHNHRTGLVRNAARSTHLARMFLKGTPYKAAEKFVRGAGEPRWDEILKMAKRYAPTSGSVAMIARFADINQEFTRWKNEP